MTYVFVCIQSREVRSEHKWSLETHKEMHVNVRCEQTCLVLFTCDQITNEKSAGGTLDIVKAVAVSFLYLLGTPALELQYKFRQ